MFFTDSGRKFPWFLALFFHHTPYLCQLINETKTESPAESESYLMFSGNYPSPVELPFKKYNYFCWCKEFSDPLYIYNHETCLLSEFFNRNSMYLFPSKAYIKVCNQLTMPICRSTTFCSIHSIQQKDLMLWSSTLGNNYYLKCPDTYQYFYVIFLGSRYLDYSMSNFSRSLIASWSSPGYLWSGVQLAWRFPTRGRWTNGQVLNSAVVLQPHFR